MGNRISLEPTWYRPKDRPACWKVDIPASVAGKRVRKFFPTKPKADEYCEDFMESVRLRGAKDAVGHSRVSIGKAVWDYVGGRESTSSARHAETMRRYAYAVERQWGRTDIAALTIRNVERWLAKPTWGARTQWNALGFLSSFLAWAQRREMVERNVAAVLRSERAKPEGKKEILEPGEMALLLRLTRRDAVMRSFLVFGAFAGVRSAEILRLNWTACDWEEEEIHIGRGVIKKTKGVRERYIKMRPLFLAFVPRDEKGLVIPHTQRGFQRRMDKLRLRMLGVLRRGGDPLAERWTNWPDNCLRHSFASYLLAEKEDAGYVAHQLGHTSPTMVHQSYARAVKKTAVAQWNALSSCVARCS